jgi:hypothetical protein
MGNMLNWRHQPKEVRVIYLEEQGLIYPILWPDSFAKFVLELHNLFPVTKHLKKTKFMFQDATENPVCVCSESTFQALVPKHKEIAPSVELYYVSLERWLV